MVQFDLLSDRNFLGAVVVALIISFAMLGVFFFLALYMQDILGYSPLEAGVQVPALDADDRRRRAGRRPARRPLRAALADRRRAGRCVAASLFTFSGIAVDSSYLDLLPGFMLLGIGIAMTMSPMTSAAMNAVPVQKAGHRLRRALDVPHGRRQPRRRRHRGDLPGPGRLQLDSLLTGSGNLRRAARARNLRTARRRLGLGRTCRGSTPPRPSRPRPPAARFVYALGHGDDRLRVRRPRPAR